MSIIKKTALQSFSISVLALAMVACGGGSDDSKPATNNNTLTTPNEVAKAAAAVIVANMTFDKVLSIGQKGIADRISKGLGNGQNLTCNKNVGVGVIVGVKVTVGVGVSVGGKFVAPHNSISVKPNAALAWAGSKK